MPGKTNDTNHHGEDRFSQKLKLYEGLRVLPNNVSRANSAVIWIAAICTIGLFGLAEARAPWYAYLILALLSLQYCLFAVWREKNAKAKQKQFTGKSPPQSGICPADLRPDASGPAP
jgi:hypothetical protein